MRKREREWKRTRMRENEIKLDRERERKLQAPPYQKPEKENYNISLGINPPSSPHNNTKKTGAGTAGL